MATEEALAIIDYLTDLDVPKIFVTFLKDGCVVIGQENPVSLDSYSNEDIQSHWETYTTRDGKINSVISPKLSSFIDIYRAIDNLKNPKLFINVM